MEHEDVIKKVAKLLKLATSTNPHEAANAAAQAQRLMDEYRLSTQDVSVEADPIEAAILDEGPQKRVKSVWLGRLAAYLAKHNGVVAIWYGTQLKFVGRHSDVQIVMYLHTYLADEINRLAKLHGAGMGRAYANAFRNGAVTTIARRLQDDRAVQPTGSASAALVVQRDAAVREWLVAHIGKLKAPRKVSLGSDARGYHDGQQAGERIELRRGVESGEVSRKLQPTVVS